MDTITDENEDEIFDDEEESDGLTVIDLDEKQEEE